MFKRRQILGIYFVSTLAVVVLVSMLVTAAIFSVRGNLAASQHLTTGDAALKAAESGLRYAQTKLCSNPAWRGDDDALTVNDPHLVVEERDGNVFGYLKSPDGGVAQFRIRFNWQDDSQEDRDNLKDPAAAYHVDHPYVSINNFSGGSPIGVPRADGPNFSVSKTSARPYELPGGSACVIVEGRVGPGLSHLSSSNLNPKLSPGSVVTRVIEANFRGGERPGADAAAMAAGDIFAELMNDKDSVFYVASKSGTPRVRSKKTVEIAGGHDQENFVSKEGEVHTKDNQLRAAPVSVDKVKTDFEEADSNFYKLEWDEVKKATPSDGKMSAGTYVVWDDGSIHYYDRGYQDYVKFIEANPDNGGTIVTTLPDGMTFDKNKLTITKNVLITSTTSTDEFNLIPRKGAQEDPSNASGGGGGDPVQDGAELVNSLPAPFYTSVSPSVAKWTVPLAQSLGSPIGIHMGYISDQWKVDLIDNNDGTGTLILDDLYNVDLGVSAGINPQLAMTNAANNLAGNSQFQTMLSYISSSGGSGMKEIDLGASINPVLTANDLTVEFKPEGGQSAILSADGNVNLASKVKGDGGSITSQGNIRFVGAGSDLNASIEDGLNLYAKGDIILSSLLPKKDGSYEYKDFKMKGVIYTWGDFQAKIGHDDDTVKKWGKFKLDGALVAYGSRNQATLGAPGDGDGGSITIKAKEVKLTFDAAYLSVIQTKIEAGRIEQTLYSVY